MTEPITPRQFHEADGLEDWRVVEGASACFRTGSLSQGGRLVQAIAALEGLADHHACVDLRNDSVNVRLYTYAPAPDGLSTCDIELARQISALARDLGIAADPTAIQNLVVSVDAMVIADVLPFWRVVLGYEPRPDTPDDELNDPRERMRAQSGTILARILPGAVLRYDLTLRSPGVETAAKLGGFPWRSEP